MSALSCGISFERASRMRFGELSMAVRARNDFTSSTGSGGDRGRSSDGRRVRDATQADIRRFLS